MIQVMKLTDLIGFVYESQSELGLIKPSHSDIVQITLGCFSLTSHFSVFSALLFSPFLKKWGEGSKRSSILNGAISCPVYPQMLLSSKPVHRQAFSSAVLLEPARAL